MNIKLRRLLYKAMFLFAGSFVVAVMILTWLYPEGGH